MGNGVRLWRRDHNQAQVWLIEDRQLNKYLEDAVKCETKKFKVELIFRTV